MDMSKTAANIGKVTAATSAGYVTDGLAGLVANGIAETLSVSIDAFVGLSQKRKNELFDDEHFVQKMVIEIRKSDDFAAFVLDLWRRYNYESSERRRQELKQFLLSATNNEQKDFENFSKIFLIQQQITTYEIFIVKAFYKPNASTYSDNPTSSQSYQLNVNQLQRLAVPENSREEIIATISETLTQLGNYGLLSEQSSTWGGPYYRPVRFGRIFIQYVLQ